MRPELSKSSVLLISEDERMQRMASWILLEEGYYVAVSARAAEAVEQQLPQTPDVVLIDARDRVMREDAAALRAAFSHARLAALHFHGSPVIEHIDAECHLHTPFHADELLECVASALGAPVGAKSAHLHD